jgi:hypothetical protein
VIGRHKQPNEIDSNNHNDRRTCSVKNKLPLAPITLWYLTDSEWKKRFFFSSLLKHWKYTLCYHTVTL